MQDQLAGFVTNKQWPAARVRWGDQQQEHRFSHDGEQHRFTMTAQLPRGEHEVILEFMEQEGVQGAMEVLGMEVNGAPMGMAIYQCEYRPFHREAMQSHMYMGWPGQWVIKIQEPVNENYGAVGFG
jgi:hypothetical protein